MIFIHKRAEGDLSVLLEANGFELLLLDSGLAIIDEIQPIVSFLRANAIQADWLIVDHYEIDERWETLLQAEVRNTLVIDDLADRPHHCDLLLDQNFYSNMGIRYRNLLPKACRQLLGPSYALIRSEFRIARQFMESKDGVVKNILIFYGGSDPTNETLKALQALTRVQLSSVHTDVVVGMSNPNKGMIEAIVKDQPHMSFHCQVSNMAELMARSDLAFGAGGSATWERMYLGLPTIATVVAQNQKESLKALGHLNLVYNMGWHAEICGDNLATAFLSLISHRDKLLEMRKRALAFMGESVSSAVVCELLKG